MCSEILNLHSLMSNFHPRAKTEERALPQGEGADGILVFKVGNLSENIDLQ